MAVCSGRCSRSLMDRHCYRHGPTQSVRSAVCRRCDSYERDTAIYSVSIKFLALVLHVCCRSRSFLLGVGSCCPVYSVAGWWCFSTLLFSKTHFFFAFFRSPFSHSFVFPAASSQASTLHRFFLLPPLIYEFEAPIDHLTSI